MRRTRGPGSQSPPLDGQQPPLPRVAAIASGHCSPTLSPFISGTSITTTALPFSSN